MLFFFKSETREQQPHDRSAAANKMATSSKPILRIAASIYCDGAGVGVGWGGGWFVETIRLAGYFCIIERAGRSLRGLHGGTEGIFVKT